MKTVDSISQDEFEATIQKYITWAAKWDGSLPADVFFGAWADMHQEKQPIELKARVVAGRLQITAPSESPVKVVDNHIFIEERAEIIINLEIGESALEPA